MTELHRPAADRPLFRLTLRPEPDVADPLRALRAALKRLLRDHGLRCLAIEEQPTGLHQHPPEPLTCSDDACDAPSSFHGSRAMTPIIQFPVKCGIGPPAETPETRFKSST